MGLLASWIGSTLPKIEGPGDQKSNDDDPGENEGQLHQDGWTLDKRGWKAWGGSEDNMSTIVDTTPPLIHTGRPDG